MTVPRFWREISSRYNLIGSRCGKCKKIYFPPRVICPQCHRESIGKIERVKLNGKGKVVTYTIIHEARKDFELQIPYVMGIVELEEGVRLLGQIIDCPPEDVTIGMPVKTTFRKLGEDGKAGVIHYGYKFIPD